MITVSVTAVRWIYFTCCWPQVEQSQTWLETGNTVPLSAGWTLFLPAASATTDNTRSQYHQLTKPKDLLNLKLIFFFSFCQLLPESHSEVFSSDHSVPRHRARRLEVDDPLQAFWQPHRTQEVEGTQAMAGVGEVQQCPRLYQEVDGWMWIQCKEEESNEHSSSMNEVVPL